MQKFENMDVIAALEAIIKILNTRVQNLGIRKAMVKFTVIVKIPAGIAVAEFLCEFCRKNWN